MTESRVFRRFPGFRHTEVYTWDKHPVPRTIESSGTLRFGMPEKRLQVRRGDPMTKSLTLESPGVTRSFNLANGWDAGIWHRVTPGYFRNDHQALSGESALARTVTIKTPEMSRANTHAAEYKVTPWSISGGGRHLGRANIRRSPEGLDIALTDCKLESTLAWSLRYDRPGRASLYDRQVVDSASPVLIISADDPETLLKTVRYLVLELTHLVVPAEFVSAAVVDPSRTKDHTPCRLHAHKPAPAYQSTMSVW